MLVEISADNALFTAENRCYEQILSSTKKSSLAMFLISGEDHLQETIYNC